ncbi:MAG: Tat pathway signal protein [Colwelliaceae bacterium]|nr:Tat pathway signal protein [Colwelliaceae bacterium]|tara:strand:- start:360 stop:1025 length:666 start_codon:yes stop_codon:yes gene_type:complete
MSFFDPKYKTPSWLRAKLSRRNLLKSAAGASAVAAMPKALAWTAEKQSKLLSLKKSDPWLTLDAVLLHLLPSSPTGPGAEDIQALAYLFNVVDEQPIDEAEKQFIFNGVGWLNGFSESELQQPFVALTQVQKEQILRKISGSRAGHNWINTLINYVYEAMLSPPAYGGNPDGIGWQWLEHQAGFPLPAKGKRFYEIPGRHKQRVNNRIAVKNLTPEETRKA